MTYISSMYAELMIRAITGKTYAGSHDAGTLDVDSLKNDQEALRRKINSLASKKSRLTKLAQYDEHAKAELEETEAQLAELRTYRPAASTSVIKAVSVAELKKALLSLDRADLPEDVQDIIAKLG